MDGSASDGFLRRMLLTEALGVAERFHQSYERTGDLADLASAMDGFEKVLAAASDADTRSAALNGMGIALDSRVERFGRLEDLDKAIDLFRQALAIFPDHDFAASTSPTSSPGSRPSQGMPARRSPPSARILRVPSKCAGE